MRYFDLSADLHAPGRWELGMPTDGQGREVEEWWRFTDGHPMTLEQPLRVPLREHGGTPLDYSEAGISIPIVSSRVAMLLTELVPGDVQLLPVEVESQADPFYILVVTRLVKCIDDERSEEVQYWKPEDGRPERVGQYRSVFRMRIDPTQVGGAKVFRTWGWTSALIVSEDVKQALEHMRATGLKFTEVTGPGAISEGARTHDRKRRDLLERPYAAREAVWRTLGTLDKMAITPVAIEHSWPGHRQLWRVIKRDGGRTLLVTHGLSDPFIEHLESSVGFGLELALETDQLREPIEESWPFMLLERVAKEVVIHEQVREGAKAGLFSLEVSGEGLPKSLVTEEGRVGVLLGVESSTLPRHFSTPFGAVRLATVKALLPSEWAYLLEYDAKGREELARRFVERGEEHLSRARRQPVV
jgi:hypothetical protein